MDGVILDTERIFIESSQEAARLLGLPDVTELCRSTIGITAEKSKQIFSEGIGDEEMFRRFWDESKRIIKESLAKEIPVKSGARELLQYLYDNKIPTAIASSTITRIIVKEMIAADLFGFFTRIVGGDMVEKSKPDPEIFLKAAEMLGEKPEHCLVLEDSRNGVLAANAAGMKVFIIPDLVPVDDEMKEKADKVFDSLGDVIPFFLDQ